MVEYVNSNIRITKEQREFLKNSEYCLSKMIRKLLEDLMRKNHKLSNHL